MDFPSPWILPAAGPGRLMAGAATAPSVRHGGNDISCLPGLTMDLLTFKQIYTTCARQYSGTHIYTANKVFKKFLLIAVQISVGLRVQHETCVYSGEVNDKSSQAS